VSAPPPVVAYIGLGSNLDSPGDQVRRALSVLADAQGVDLLAQSALYRSAPMGPADQPWYVNAVARIATELAPLALLDLLQGIEALHGRERGARWGPRTLDLDLLLYADRVLDMPRLRVPHPGIAERAFVLVPLHEIAPVLVLPDGTAVADLVDAARRAEVERLVD
jgi:2-amino-4-hydroxy-6-hydroxymethyldihydropteridine diphosphokinase